MAETLVFGHRNPDADSIASAIGYAWLASETSAEGAFVAARLGELNSETVWALDRFELEAPRLIAHVRMTALDAMNRDVHVAMPATPMSDVGALMLAHDFRAVPIVDGGFLVGIVSQRDLARRYLEQTVTDLSLPAESLMDGDPLVVAPDDLLSDVRADLIASVHREALVCDESGALLGLISRTDLARAGAKPVVLVDHSESSQSAEGLHEARVVAVVDHHRLGDVESVEPITVIARPVGATSSIVASLARDAGLTPPAPIAGMLLAAILSDTLVLRSPTAASLDREMTEWLAPIAGLEPEAFGLEMIALRSEAILEPEAAVTADLKLYNFAGQRVAIAQLETVDRASVLARRDELVAALEALARARELDLAVLMVTDVVTEGSVLLSAGRTRALERAFDLEGDPQRLLPGVLSRKKQVAAVLARSLGASQ